MSIRMGRIFCVLRSIYKGKVNKAIDNFVRFAYNNFRILYSLFILEMPVLSPEEFVA